MNTKSIAQRSNTTNNAHLLLTPFVILIFLLKECILGLTRALARSEYNGVELRVLAHAALLRSDCH